jgi:O-antigen/teichoic acid export membrane protein
MVLTPLWPAYGEAISRGDVAWVRRTLLRSLRISLVLGSVAAIVLVAFGRPILHLWVGPQINPPFMLLLGLGVWTVLAAVGNAVAVFLNGIHVIRAQAVCGIIMSVASLGLSIALTKLFGLPGVIWGTIIAYVLFVVGPLGLMIPRYLRQLSDRAVIDGAAVDAPLIPPAANVENTAPMSQQVGDASS